jgi:hypothetical protein
MYAKLFLGRLRDERPCRDPVPVAGADRARGLTDEHDLLRPNSSRGNSFLIPMWVDRAPLDDTPRGRCPGGRAGARATRDQGYAEGTALLRLTVTCR